MIAQNGIWDIIRAQETALESRGGQWVDTLRSWLAQPHDLQPLVPSLQFISEVIIDVLKTKHSDFGSDAQGALRKALELFRNDIAAKYKELGFQG